jgi:phosphoglycolate phosphatase
LVTVTVHDRKYLIDAILFDKDGTLIDFASLWLAWLDALLDTLGETVTVPIQRSDLASAVGADLISRTHDAGGPLAVGSNSEVRLVLAQRLYVSGLRWEQACAAVESASRAVDTWLSEESLIDPAAGVLDFIGRARELGVRMGVVTADDQERTLRHLELLGLRDSIEVVIGADTVSSGKPDPEGVLLACRLLGVAPDRALLVGDTTSDMAAATAAGLATGIRLGGGGQDDEPLFSGNGSIPLHRIERFDEVSITP